MNIKDINPASAVNNPWQNVYWFARMLINNDKYGAIGKEDTLMMNLATALRYILGDNTIDNEQKPFIARDTIKNLALERFKNAYTKIDRINLLCTDLSDKINSPDDIAVLILTIEHVMLPINVAICKIPSNDREYTVEIAKSYLERLGSNGLANVINFWDDAGTNGCLGAERNHVVREFGALRHLIREHDDITIDLILTAFVQEFERRAAQKRKGRAGGSLEDVASFLFDYFKIKADNKPEHFQADIEVDKWIRCKDKWLIGISCKRTLRERWKQVSSADANTLSKFKIRYIWHLITYDEDLSDDKITLLGGQRHIFYLRDDSRKLLNAQEKVGLRDYVRPMSKFIDDIRREQSI